MLSYGEVHAACREPRLTDHSGLTSEANEKAQVHCSFYKRATGWWM